MKPQNSSQGVAELERLILRALCDSALDATARAQTERRLAIYRWREPDHAVVFRAILAMRNRGLKGWREELPAETTRMGFPDLNWAVFLRPDSKPGHGVSQLLAALEAAEAR